MTDGGTPAHHPARPRFVERRSSPWVLCGLLPVTMAIGALGIVGRAAVEHRRTPPSCYGIGWGCEPDAWSAGAFVFLLIGIPALVLAAAALGLTELAGPHFTKWRIGLVVAAHVVVLGFGAWATFAV